MLVHHIHICERPSWWNQCNLLVGGINGKDLVDFVVIMELMEPEVRESMESMELIEIMELVKRNNWFRDIYRADLSDVIDGTY